MDEAMRAQALDYLMVFIAVAALVLGLGSMFLGRIVSLWDSFQTWRQSSVSHFQPVMSPAPPSSTPDRQTDRADRPRVSADNLEVPRLQLDKTKTTIIEVLVYNGWQVGEIRSVLKGDNGVIGTEVEAARKRLGIELPERTLKVKDERGERVISY